MLGIMLLVSPALVSATNFSVFYYSNPGQKTYMNITNNAVGANFTIRSAGWNGSLPIVVKGGNNDTGFNASISWIGGFQSLILNGTATGQKGAFFPYLSNSTAYFENTTGWQDLLIEMASTYLITGSGANATVTIFGGITPDIYSIVTPGAGAIVNITTGGGDATYAVQVGLNGTVIINPAWYLQNATTGTIGLFNIVYDSNFY